MISKRISVSTDMGVTDEGMVLTTAPSMVIEYDLIYPNGYDAVLAYSVDFSPQGGAMGGILREVGDYFNRIQNAGSSDALADKTDLVQLRNGFDQP